MAERWESPETSRNEEMSGHVTYHSSRYDLRVDDAFGLFAARLPAWDWNFSKIKLYIYIYIYFLHWKSNGLVQGQYLNSRSNLDQISLS